MRTFLYCENKVGISFHFNCSCLEDQLSSIVYFVYQVLVEKNT